MTSEERRSTMGLAAVYGLRMLGIFLILPTFAVYASKLPHHPSHFLIGLAFGAYGLTQALLQLPFGIASDHFGRKLIIYIGLSIFALGSLIATWASSIEMLIIGRAVQGAGAMSAAVTALLADLTRSEVRTKAMAAIGATIGLSFALSLVAGPLLTDWIGVQGIFMLTALLAVCALLVVRLVVPNPPALQNHTEHVMAPPLSKLRDVLGNQRLLALNYGILTLHATQMAMFVVLPFAIIRTSGLAEGMHWKIYLPLLLLSLLFMVPAILFAERRTYTKRVFLLAIMLMLLVQMLFAFLLNSFVGIIFSLALYFVAFNILEAMLPSLISKIAPSAIRGTALGVYNTSQSLGIFVGGVWGGYLSQLTNPNMVFVFCGGMVFLWLLFASFMQSP
ncbi:MAG: MFS transporter [Methylophilaceae bacterium]|nr:MFS transporter [Methylophilaceae bacterium]